MSAARYDVGELRRFAGALLEDAGMSASPAATVADLLVEGDLLGHDTHGLQLLGRYLDDLRGGRMNPDADPVTIKDTGATAVWDGEWRSGVWLTALAVDTAVERAGRYGIAAISIGRSHHIACLQAYLRRATDRGMVVAITCSDPTSATVAAYGGVTPVFQPDPIAIGIPTEAGPILVDLSTSVTSNASVNRAAAEGDLLPGRWVQDAAGVASDDPRVFTEGGGTILPAGGPDHGHKGTALALVVEALTQGLSGRGRSDAEPRWTASVLVQAWDPAFFAGTQELRHHAGWIADAVRDSKPRDASRPPRVPGDQALARRELSLREGLALRPSILEELQHHAATAGVRMPDPR